LPLENQLLNLDLIKNVWFFGFNSFPNMLVFSPPRLLIYIAVITLGVSWAMVPGGGYLGVELYRNYLQLKEQKTRLLEKKKEWDDLKLDVKRVQKKEEFIREVLGLEKLNSTEGLLSQRGMPVTDLSSIDSKDAMAKDNMRSIAPVRLSSIKCLPS
jgi:hypothetical protein